MTTKENWPKKCAGLKDAIAAWLVVLAAIAAMNLVVTLAAAPSCFKRLHGLQEAALHGVMLLAGMADSASCQ